MPAQIATGLVISRALAVSIPIQISKLTVANLTADGHSFLIAANEGKTKSQHMLQILRRTISDLEQLFSGTRSYRGATRAVYREPLSIHLPLVLQAYDVFFTG